MINEPLGFAIIGTGSIAGHHAASINALPGAKLMAVSSSTAQRAEAATARFGVPAFTDYQELLQYPGIDVVCICTESGNHLEPTLAAAQAGKHVICEKPLEVNAERAQQMIDACDEAGVELACIFQKRFDPNFQRLKKAVQDGQLGKLILANAYIKWYRDHDYYGNSAWRGTLEGDGGAALINQGIHTIDLLLDIMGEVDAVFAKVKTVTHDIEGEDLGVALLTFKNGALGTIEGSTSAFPGYPERLEVFGDKGSVIIEGSDIIAWNIEGQKSTVLPNSKSEASGAADPMAISHELHTAQFQDMIEAIRENRRPLVDGKEGLKSIRLIRAIYASSREQKELKLNY